VLEVELLQILLHLRLDIPSFDSPKPAEEPDVVGRAQVFEKGIVLRTQTNASAGLAALPSDVIAIYQSSPRSG